MMKSNFKKVINKYLLLRNSFLKDLRLRKLKVKSIWIKANKGMTQSLVSEIKTLFDVYRSEATRNIQFLTNSYKKNFDFVINIKDEDLPKTKSDRRFSPMDRSLRREKKPVFGNNYWFDTVTYIDLVDLRIKSDDKIIQIFF